MFIWSDEDGYYHTLLFDKNELIYCFNMAQVNFRLPLFFQRFAKNNYEIVNDQLEESLFYESPQDKEVDYDAYLDFDYTDIMRERDGLSGAKHKFKRTLVQYEEPTSTMAGGLIFRDGDPDQGYFAIWKEFPEKRYVVNDNLIVYGTLTGLYTYESVQGTKITVPQILIDYAYVD